MDPGFHRGDGKAGMTGTRADFQSINSQPSAWSLNGELK
jgi:hypothetical protein